MLENWGDALKRYCALETCWLVLWTRPAVLPDSLRKAALKERTISMNKVPTIPGCQQVSRSAIRIGDRIYGPLIMTLMPQTPKPFQDFFRVLARRDERVPYRMSFLLKDGGLNLGLKPLLSSVRNRRHGLT